MNETVDWPEPLSPEFKMGITVYYIFLIVTGVLFNVILMATIISKRRLHSITNTFIVNMAFGDLVTSVFLVPFDVDLFVRGTFPHGVVMCGFREMSFLLSLPSSVNCLLLLTIERFISIVFPFHRIRYLRKNRAVIAIVATWTYNLFFALMPLFLSRQAVIVHEGHCILQYPLAYIYTQLGLNFLTPVIVIACLNIVLFHVASKHAISMKRRSLVGTQHKIRPSMIKLGANLRAAKTVLLLVAVFLVCWLTFIVLGIWNTYCQSCHPRFVTYLGNAINYSSIMLNPILYGLRNSEIRRQIVRTSKQVMYRHCRCLDTSGLESDRSGSGRSTRFTISDSAMYENDQKKKMLKTVNFTESET